MQLKNIDDIDTPDEVSLEDAMRMKKTKKKELKRIKIVSQGETFGAEEF